MSTSESAGEAATAESMIGRRLVGRYLVSERIGQGGMATVYRASDEQLGRDVALKVFNRGLTSPEDLQRQEGEVRHLASLAHPCLVTLYDAVFEDERSFLVLEYVRGHDLRQRLREGPLPPSAVAALGGDIARALAHIHSRDLIHRDVSPGNILLPAPPHHVDGVAAKLTDLGIARVVDEGHNITATGTLIGTAAYLSPEQVRGRPVTAAGDVYSLGLVLLECLTGERAFDGPATESAIARLSRDPDAEKVPSHWRSLIAAMTAREPADRPTASEVAVTLADPAFSVDPEESTALLAAPQVEAEPPQETQVFERPQSGFVDAVTMQVPVASPRESAVLERLRKVPTPWIVLAVAGLAFIVVVAWAILGSGDHPTPTPPAPSYPDVPGQLGTDLKQLQHDVAPN